MTTRPTVAPAFATAATFSAGAESGLVPRLDPGSGLRAQGFYPSRAVPARWFNYLIGLLGDWSQYLDEKSAFEFNPVQYGADPTGVANSTTAFQAAHDAASAAGAGTVVPPPGNYKFNTGLTWNKSVSLCAVPNSVVMSLNHATADLITFGTGPSTGAPSVISGIQFEGSIATTGRIFYDSGVQSRVVRIDDCSANFSSTNLQGGLFRSDGNASSRFLLDNFNFRHVAAAIDAIRCDNGVLVLRHGKLIAPASLTAALVLGSAGKHFYDGVYFDTSAHTSGAGGSIKHTGAQTVMTGCTFDDGSGNGTPQVTFSVPSAKFSASGNAGIGCQIYGTAPAGMLLYGSSLDLHPFAFESYAGASKTVPTGYASYSIKFIGASTPTLSMPPIFYPGQTLDLVVWNGGTWTSLVVLMGAGFKQSLPASITANTGVSAHFVAGDPTNSGTPVWVQVGNWCALS